MKVFVIKRRKLKNVYYTFFHTKQMKRTKRKILALMTHPICSFPPYLYRKNIFFSIKSTTSTNFTQFSFINLKDILIRNITRK